METNTLLGDGEQSSESEFLAKLEKRMEEYMAINTKIAELSATTGNEVQIFHLNAEIGRMLIIDYCKRQIAFDLEGVAALEEYISVINVPGAYYPALMFGFSFFLGECLIRFYGGKWVLLENKWEIEIAGKAWVDPKWWVNKRFKNGQEDNLVFKFQSIKALLNRI